MESVVFNFNFHEWPGPEFEATLDHISNQLEQIMASKQEVIDQLAAAAVAQRKTLEEIGSLQTVIVELNQKVTDMQAIIDTMGTDAPAELVAAAQTVFDLATLADQKIEDLVVPPIPEPAPDPVPEPPVEPLPTP